MAQRLKVTLIDDLDGSTAVESVRFSLDGVDYEIDLSQQNGEALRESFEPWVKRARRVSGRKRRKGAVAARASRGDLQEIRQWAWANGYKELSSKGRVPAYILTAYDKANPSR